jgi:hypothetical protein
VSQGFHLQFVLGNFFPVDADIHEGIRLVVVVPTINQEGRASWHVSVGGAQGPRCWSDGGARRGGEAYRVDIVARLSIQGECESLVRVLVEC